MRQGGVVWNNFVKSKLSYLQKEDQPLEPAGDGHKSKKKFVNFITGNGSCIVMKYKDPGQGPLAEPNASPRAKNVEFILKHGDTYTGD